MKTWLLSLLVLLWAGGLTGCLTMGGFAKADGSDLYVLTAPKPFGSPSVMVCSAGGACTEYVSGDVMKAAGLKGLGHKLYALEALPEDDGVLVAGGSLMEAGRIWHCLNGKCQELAGISGLGGLGGKLEGNAEGLSALLGRRASAPSMASDPLPTEPEEAITEEAEEFDE